MNDHLEWCEEDFDATVYTRRLQAGLVEDPYRVYWFERVRLPAGDIEERWERLQDGEACASLASEGRLLAFGAIAPWPMIVKVSRFGPSAWLYHDPVPPRSPFVWCSAPYSEIVLVRGQPCFLHCERLPMSRT